MLKVTLIKDHGYSWYALNYMNKEYSQLKNVFAKSQDVCLIGQ